ncbi:MAG: transketolase [Spirochaetes bacterium]|nr:transketolase [Spirochaetota bacterium]
MVDSTVERKIDIDGIKDLATQIRRDVIRMIVGVGSGHPGGALGAAELFALLYGGVLHIDPKNLMDPHRDRFVLSNGHICAAFYSALSLAGFLPREELNTFRRINSRLQGHPARVKLPDLVETSSGPLGQGFSVANGIAMAMKLDGSRGRVYCLVGDGEMQEGQVWEAIMTAAHHKLANLTLIVSYNGLQIDGEVRTVKNLMPLREKFESFGWECVEADGHDVVSLYRAFTELSVMNKTDQDKPKAVIAHTVMGKGVPFMENKAVWHGSCPTPAQAEEALLSIGKSKGFEDYPPLSKQTLSRKKGGLK